MGRGQGGGGRLRVGQVVNTRASGRARITSVRRGNRAILGGAPLVSFRPINARPGSVADSNFVARRSSVTPAGRRGRR